MCVGERDKALSVWFVFGGMCRNMVCVGFWCVSLSFVRRISGLSSVFADGGLSVCSAVLLLDGWNR